MGSCASKTANVVSPKSQTLTRREDDSRVAAGRAAEQRYRVQQEQREQGRARLKELAKVLRKDKGLA